MGLFSSKSKSSSSSTTSYTDNSRNINVDLSSGDLASSGGKNIVAGGDVNIDGLSEDLATQIFGVMDNTYKTAAEWVTKAVGTVNTQNEKTVAAIQQAYNSETATLSGFKSYAMYALFGFVAWAYLTKGRK